MRNSYNKKKLQFLNIRNFLKYFILFFFLSSLIFFTYNELKNKDRLYNLIQMFSDKFEYNFELYKVNNLQRVDKSKISQIMYKYLDRSIFLLPLNIISEDIHNIKWVKYVNLKTNLKNIVNINIIEYVPIGLYSINEQLYYFSEEGKIIDQLNTKINENFTIFYGNKSLKKADNFLKKINKIKQTHLLKIKEAYYVNDRRWNVKLDNNLLLYLSEINFETSLINYIKLYKKLEKSEIVSIKSIDLRNDKKAIISLKIDD